MMKKHLELLAPAGNFEKLQIALHYGADAVYMGLPEFSLRSQIKDIDEEVVKKSIQYVRERKKKIYITINIYPHNRDLEPIKEHLQFLEEVKPDAIIFSDPGVFRLAKKYAPSLPLHVSTQANTTNYESAKFWEDLGVERIVLARELSIEEIREFRQKLKVDLEAFVHGSICIAYSGRCFLSAYMVSRSANKGECKNSCRWKYTVYYLKEDSRDSEYYPVFEDDRGTYVMSSKDLNMVAHLPLLVDAGVTSFKIEGRMKGVNYLAGVVKVYREALDLIQEQSFFVDKDWFEELEQFSNRGFTTGMYFGQHPVDGFQHDGVSRHIPEMSLAGIIQEVEEDGIWIQARDKLCTGDKILILRKGLEKETFRIMNIKTSNKETDVLKNGEMAKLILDKEIPEGVQALDIVRKIKVSAV